MTYRIKMLSETDWGFSFDDEHSGFSLWGYATKAEARAAADEYAAQMAEL